MALKARLFSVALLLWSSGCASPHIGNLSDALRACNSGAHYAEMNDSGTIWRVLGVHNGPSGAHEGFLVHIPFRAPNGALTQGVSRAWKVEDNVDITGPIPLRRGDNVTLQGQLECDDNVIHWTHRDPRGRHIAGYIEVNGQRYQ
jgi:hypothetical protein